MRRITTITGPDGKITKITTRSSGCGCLTILAAVVVLFGPAAWFPPTLAILAYVFLGVIAVIVGVGWVLQNVRRRQPAAPAPPPSPLP